MSGYTERDRFRGTIGRSDPVRAQDRGNYKPVAIRAPALTGVFVLTLVLIALLEFACRSLPEAVSSKHPEQSERRSDGGVSGLAVAPRAFTTPSLSPSTTSYLLGQSKGDLSDTDIGGMWGPGTGNDSLLAPVTEAIMTDPETHMGLTFTVTITAPKIAKSQPAGKTPTGAQRGPISKIETPMPSKQPLLHSTTPTQKGIEGSSEVAGQLVVSLDATARSSSLTGSGNLGGGTPRPSQTIDPISHLGQPTENRNPHKTTLQPGVATTDSIPRSLKPTSNRTPKGTIPQQTAVTTALGPGPDNNSGNKDNENDSDNDGDNSNGKDNDDDRDNDNSNSNNDDNGDDNGNGNDNNNSYNSNATTITTIVIRWPIYKYLIGAYLPTLISITYRAAWATIYASTKLLEPFYQLSEPTGALAQDALGLCYLSSSLTPSPMIRLATTRRHSVMLLTSIAYVVSGALIPPLASETLFVDTRGCGGRAGRKKCPPRLAVARASGRVVQGLLGFLAAVALGLIFLQRRRRSGVRADPSRIATVAALLHHPDVVKDFRAVSAEAVPAELHRQLSGRRYQLAHYSSPGGDLRYGLVPVRGGPNTTPPKPPPHDQRRKGRLSNPALRLILREAAFCLLLAGILGLIAAYWRERGDTGFNRFMNSQTFGPRFLMTSLGVLIDSQWKRLEREVRAVNPYRILAQGHARARDTLAVNFTSTPLTTFTASLYRRHFFVAFIASVALLSEILVVALPGIPFSSSQTYAAFRASTYTSVAILALMVFAVFALAYWRRRPHLPRMPNTLAAVLSYVCASRMLEDHRVLQDVGSGDRPGGQTFSYGRLKGVDAVTRWAVDMDTNSGVA